MGAEMTANMLLEATVSSCWSSSPSQLRHRTP